MPVSSPPRGRRPSGGGLAGRSAPLSLMSRMAAVIKLDQQERAPEVGDGLPPTNRFADALLQPQACPALSMGLLGKGAATTDAGSGDNTPGKHHPRPKAAPSAQTGGGGGTKRTSSPSQALRQAVTGTGRSTSVPSTASAAANESSVSGHMSQPPEGLAAAATGDCGQRPLEGVAMAEGTTMATHVSPSGLFSRPRSRPPLLAKASREETRSEVSSPSVSAHGQQQPPLTPPQLRKLPAQVEAIQLESQRSHASRRAARANGPRQPSPTPKGSHGAMSPPTPKQFPGGASPSTPSRLGPGSQEGSASRRDGSPAHYHPVPTPPLAIGQSAEAASRPETSSRRVVKGGAGGGSVRGGGGGGSVRGGGGGGGSVRKQVPSSTRGATGRSKGGATASGGKGATAKAGAGDTPRVGGSSGPSGGPLASGLLPTSGLLQSKPLSGLALPSISELPEESGAEAEEGTAVGGGDVTDAVPTATATRGGGTDSESVVAAATPPGLTTSASAGSGVTPSAHAAAPVAAGGGKASHVPYWKRAGPESRFGSPPPKERAAERNGTLQRPLPPPSPSKAVAPGTAAKSSQGTPPAPLQPTPPPIAPSLSTAPLVPASAPLASIAMAGTSTSAALTWTAAMPPAAASASTPEKPVVISAYHSSATAAARPSTGQRAPQSKPPTPPQPPPPSPPPQQSQQQPQPPSSQPLSLPLPSQPQQPQQRSQQPSDSQLQPELQQQLPPQRTAASQKSAAQVAPQQPIATPPTASQQRAPSAHASGGGRGPPPRGSSRSTLSASSDAAVAAVAPTAAPAAPLISGGGSGELSENALASTPPSKTSPVGVLPKLGSPSGDGSPTPPLSVAPVMGATAYVTPPVTQSPQVVQAAQVAPASTSQSPPSRVPYWKRATEKRYPYAPTKAAGERPPVSQRAATPPKASALRGASASGTPPKPADAAGRVLRKPEHNAATSPVKGSSAAARVAQSTPATAMETASESCARAPSVGTDGTQSRQQQQQQQVVGRGSSARPGAVHSAAMGFESPVRRARERVSPLKPIMEHAYDEEDEAEVGDGDPHGAGAPGGATTFLHLSQHRGLLPSGRHQGVELKLSGSGKGDGAHEPPRQPARDELRDELSRDRDELSREEHKAATEYARHVERTASEWPGSDGPKCGGGSSQVSAARPRRLQMPAPPAAAPPVAVPTRAGEPRPSGAKPLGKPRLQVSRAHAPAKAPMNQEPTARTAPSIALSEQSTYQMGEVSTYRTSEASEASSKSDDITIASSRRSSTISLRSDDIDAMGEEELRVVAKQLAREVRASHSKIRHQGHTPNGGMGGGHAAMSAGRTQAGRSHRGTFSKIASHDSSSVGSLIGSLLASSPLRNGPPRPPSIPSSEGSTHRSWGGFSSVLGSEVTSAAPSAQSTLRGAVPASRRPFGLPSMPPVGLTSAGLDGRLDAPGSGVPEELTSTFATLSLAAPHGMAITPDQPEDTDLLSRQLFTIAEMAEAADEDGEVAERGSPQSPHELQDLHATMRIHDHVHPVAVC